MTSKKGSSSSQQRIQERVELDLEETEDFHLNISTLASKFIARDIRALKVSIRPAGKSRVIPDNDARLPADFPILPSINTTLLRTLDFNVNKLGLTEPEFKTFAYKLRKAVMSAYLVEETKETEEKVQSDSATNSLLDYMLCIVGLDRWPLRKMYSPKRKLFIDGQPHVLAEPKFVIMRDENDKTLAKLIIKGKHARNVTSANKYGEAPIVAEILACGYQNICYDPEIPHQTIYAIRVISTFVTFYKADISAMYWRELDEGLPQTQSIVIERWPGENTLESGLDLTEPDKRREVLEALIKIRKALE